MGSSSDTLLARVWADAAPLAKYLEDRAERLRSKKQAATATPQPGSKPSTIELMVASMQIHSDVAAAKEAASHEAGNDLVAGRLIGLGRPPNSYTIEQIDPSFWIGAAVEWWNNTVSRAANKFVEVRVVNPDALPAAIQPRPKVGAGRPSEAEVIRDAIADYAKTDPALKRPPSLRYRAYRSYISNQGFNPRQDPGFSDKTLQKYEADFRKKYI